HKADKHAAQKPCMSRSPPPFRHLSHPRRRFSLPSPAPPQPHPANLPPLRRTHQSLPPTELVPHYKSATKSQRSTPGPSTSTAEKLRPALPAAHTTRPASPATATQSS